MSTLVICPVCGKSDRVVGLPEFVSRGGNLSHLANVGTDVPSLLFQEFVDLLSLPPWPMAPVGVAFYFRFPKKRGILPSEEMLAYVDSLARWRGVYELWRAAYVCAHEHSRAGQVPLGLRVLYWDSDGWRDVGPVEFVRRLELLL